MQFFFDKQEASKDAEDKDITITTRDSFDTDYVAMTVGKRDGTRVVILKDGRTESRYGNYPVIKGGRIVGEELRKEAAWYQSQITLNKEDSEKYEKMESYWSGEPVTG